MFKFYRVLLLGLCGLLCHVTAWANLAPTFGKIELIRDISLSPDGRYIAAVMIHEGVPVVVTTPFEQKNFTSVVGLKYPTDRINSITWVSNTRLFVNSSTMKKAGSEYYPVYRAYLVNADGSDLLELVDRNRERQKSTLEARFSSTWLENRLIDDPDHILVSTYDMRDNGNGLFKVNVHTSQFEKIESGAGDRGNFITNRAGEVLFSTVNERSGKAFRIEMRQPTGWQTIQTISLSGDHDFYPVSASEDRKSLLVVTNIDSEFNYIANYDLTSGKISKVLYADPNHDVDAGFLLDGELASYNVDGDFPHPVRVDPVLKEYQQQVDALLKDRHNYIASNSVDFSRIIFYSVSDHSPGRYYTIDFNTKKVQFFYSQFPMLEKEQLNPVQKFQFSSRDGLPIEGYLTLPKSTAAAPVILFPHGGPQARDNMEFDPWVQFFAQLGYAVVQVNYRGSTGYGTSFETAGYHQWGFAMQDDLMDAMKHLSSNPRLDTSRSCVVGASYGGYAALVASFRDSDAFQCFVSIAGISDLDELLSRDGRYNRAAQTVNTLLIGDRDKDKQRLQQASAIHQLTKITKPLLLIHGVKDTRVYYQQSVDLYKALKKTNDKVQYLELEDGTHFFDEEQDRIRAFDAMEQFLTKYLPVKS